MTHCTLMTHCALVTHCASMTHCALVTHYVLSLRAAVTLFRRSAALLFWSLSCTHVFYGAVIVDLFFIVILTVTLREIAAVFVMLGCCEFRNKMYKCSCWVSLFLYFCAPVFCYCFVNCKCNHRVFITHGWHTFRYDATGKIITVCTYVVCMWYFAKLITVSTYIDVFP